MPSKQRGRLLTSLERKAITIRVTPDQYRLIQLAAATENWSMESFCRREILAQVNYVLDEELRKAREDRTKPRPKRSLFTI